MKALVRPDYNIHCVRNAKEKNSRTPEGTVSAPWFSVQGEYQESHRRDIKGDWEMKSCKDCHEYTCGGQGSDNVSKVCGGGEEPSYTQNGMVGFGTGAIREDKTGKGRCDMLPACALLRLSKRYEGGNIAHGERNWEKGLPMHSFLDSAIRHLLKYMDGQDEEDHLAAAAWNVLGAMWTEEKKPEMQDIPTRKFTEHLKYPCVDPEEIVDG